LQPSINSNNVPTEIIHKLNLLRFWFCYLLNWSGILHVKKSMRNKIRNLVAGHDETGFLPSSQSFSCRSVRILSFTHFG
jgi:hypothetical protein